MAVTARISGNEGRLDEAAVAELVAGMRGAVLQPGDAGYDEARSVRNGLIDRTPALIVKCSGTADVIHAVNLARDNDLLLSVRGGGHNVAGSAVNDGGIVIDLSGMTAVHVDPQARTARVQGGATWADLDRESQVFGLATPGGVVSSTGVGGLTLHGGYGHLRRKHGLSIDNLLSVDIVTADGQVRTASETENADLFWAVRGAGSNFGVVTSFEFRLHPLGPEVMLSAAAYALEDAPQVLRKWREFMATAPEEISSSTIFWSIPSNPPAFPPELHGKQIMVVQGLYAGSADEGARALQPLRELATPVLDLSGVNLFTNVQSGFDAFFPAGRRSYWKSILVDGLGDEFIDEICEIAGRRPSGGVMIDIWENSGAMQRVGATETAYGDRSAPYMIALESSWDDASDDEEHIAWTRKVWSDLHRYSANGGVYLNFAGFGEEKEALLRAAYGPNYERLVKLKTKYDPTNLFRMNQNIKPHAG